MVILTDLYGISLLRVKIIWYLKGRADRLVLEILRSI